MDESTLIQSGPAWESLPMHGTAAGVLTWMEEHGFGRYFPAVRDAAMFCEQSFAPGERELRELWDEGAALSWLGGPSVDLGEGATSWPRAADGTALAHVATVALGRPSTIRDTGDRLTWSEAQRCPELPDEGVLQVFHDLSTLGFHPQDAEAAGWAVTWTPFTGTDLPGLVEAPADVVPAPAACQAGLLHAGFTLPSPVDVGAEHLAADGITLEVAALDDLDALTVMLAQAWTLQRFGAQQPWPAPSTHLFGHASGGETVARHEILPAALPLEAGDGHVLLLEVESHTTLDGWFGDAGSLEVWLRRSDLAAHRFDRAWCILRVD